MADTKITALAAITTVDPAADVLPIVDVSDTSMAASGTTKKITSNQILGAGGTATLASATITGDLTVDTSTLKVDSANNRVGIGTASPTVPLYVTGNNATATTIIQDETNGAKLRLLANSINVDISNGGGGGDIAVSGANPITFRTNGSERLRLDSSGNLGLGVTPSAWNSYYKVFQLSTIGSYIAANTTSYSAAPFLFIGNNAYGEVGSGFKYTSSQPSAQYRQENGVHQWFTAPSGTAGNAITFTQAMTLDASGNLVVGAASALSRLTLASVNAVTASWGISSIYSTDSMAIDKGGSITFGGAFTGTTVTYFAQISGRKENSTDSDVAGYLALSSRPTGGLTTDRMRVKSNGQIRFIPLAADPAGAEAGDVYYNSTSNKLKCYNGTTWNDLF